MSVFSFLLPGKVMAGYETDSTSLVSIVYV
jgi:hypothetical protein